MKLSLLVLTLVCIISITDSNAQSTLWGKSFSNHTEVGGLFGNVIYNNDPYGTQPIYAKENKVNLTIQTFNGLNLTSKLTTGITVGMDWYNDALLTPIALGVRYSLISRANVNLFGTLDAGYSFPWFHNNLNDNKLQGGTMLNPGIGWRLGKPGNGAFTIAVTYKRQEALLQMQTNRDILKQEESRLYNRLAVRLGIAF